MKRNVVMSATALALGMQSAFAMPTIYPKPSSQINKVINKTDSGVVADHLNDTHFYVLPPDNAYGYATQFNGASTNLGFCPSMASLQTSTLGLVKTLEDLQKEQAKLNELAIAADEKAAEARRVADDYKNSTQYLRQYGELSDQIELTQQRLSDLYEKQGSCGEGSACEASTQVEIASTQADLAQLRKQRTELMRQDASEASKYDKLASKAKRYEDEAAAIRNRSADRVEGIQKANTSILKMYQMYAQLEGGRVQLSFESEWDNNIQQIREANPGMSFEKVNVENVTLNAAAIPNDSAGYLRSIPAVLDYTINGQQGADTMKFVSYPSNVAGSFRLSLAGACPIANPEAFNAKNFVDGKYLFGFSAMYSFQGSFNTKIDFTYNERHFYEKIVESHSKSGFFSSKSWTSVRERRQDSKAVEFHWDVADPDNKLDFAGRRAFERETLNWVLMGIIPKVADVSGVGLQTPPVSANGATVAADALMTMCGVNLYCQAGGWVLRIASAIWGRSSSTASYSTLSETDAHMLFDENTAHPVVRLTTYNMTRKPKPPVEAQPQPQPQPIGVI